MKSAIITRSLSIHVTEKIIFELITLQLYSIPVVLGHYVNGSIYNYSACSRVARELKEVSFLRRVKISFKGEVRARFPKTVF